MIARLSRITHARVWGLCAALTFLGLSSGGVDAGGGPENALLIIDPTNADAMQVGNYYKNARNIPDRNVIYMNPRAATFADHVNFQIVALFGMLKNLGIEDHIDYIIIPPGSSYFVPAPPGVIFDNCSPVTRLSISSVYTLAFQANTILSSFFIVVFSPSNQYFALSDAAEAFDSSVGWCLGSLTDPDICPTSDHYFIGALLGYSGLRGNTVAETMAMIDRSVAADGTRPPGTFYYMETGDAPRSDPRDVNFDAAVTSIQSFGGQAEHLFGGVNCSVDNCDQTVLPLGRHDALGIMTGWATPDIDGADLTILPGAICDHMTSHAANFDNPSQTKLSRWIVKGASGSHGEVEEPCNPPGKFPSPNMHSFYFQGLSLGEAVFRSLEWLPYQGLLYGDPLTRPFAFLPTVTVPDAPVGEVSGLLTLTPMATTAHPTAGIARFDLYVDGEVRAQMAPPSPCVIDTTNWPDGAHDVRVVAFDDTLVASQGRWISTIRTNNHGRSASLAVDVSTGDTATPFTFDLSAAGTPVVEIRLVSGARVLAAIQSGMGSVTLLGKDFGPGPVHLHAEAEFDDGLLALSDEVVVDVQPTGVPVADPNPPIAFDYRKLVRRNEPIIVELPATNPDGTALTYTITSLPAQGTLEGSGPTRLLRPNTFATGTDTITFSVADAGATSNTATITLLYHIPGDFDLNRRVELRDYQTFLLCFGGSGNPPADTCPLGIDADLDVDGGDVDLNDYQMFQGNLAGPASSRFDVVRMGTTNMPLARTSSKRSFRRTRLP